MTQVRDCNKDLEHYAEYKKMAQEKERTLKSLNQDKDELGEQLNEMEEELKPLKEKQKEIDQIASGFSDIQNKYTEGMHDIFYFLQMVHHFTDLKNVSFQQRQVLKYTIDKLRILAIVWVMENCMTKLRRKFKLCKTIWQLKKKN